MKVPSAVQTRRDDAHNPETRPVKGLIRVLTRLQPVFNQIDFLSSSATVTTFDGLAGRTDGVVTYRAPAPGVR